VIVGQSEDRARDIVASQRAQSGIVRVPHDVCGREDDPRIDDTSKLVAGGGSGARGQLAIRVKETREAGIDSRATLCRRTNRESLLVLPQRSLSVEVDRSSFGYPLQPPEVVSPPLFVFRRQLRWSVNTGES
jgi:hypothetical protein